MNGCLVKTEHQSPPSGSQCSTAVVAAASVTAAVCSAKIRLCEQGLCFNSAASQGKKYTGGTLVVPHGTTGTKGTIIKQKLPLTL